MHSIAYKKLDCNPGTYLNPDNHLVVHLHKCGNIVSCSIECTAALTVGETLTIDEISIPDEYRPTVRVTMPYNNVDSGAIRANGGEWIIEETGQIRVINSDSSFIERYASMSWITNL